MRKSPNRRRDVENRRIQTLPNIFNVFNIFFKNMTPCSRFDDVICYSFQMSLLPLDGQLRYGVGDIARSYTGVPIVELYLTLASII